MNKDDNPIVNIVERKRAFSLNKHNYAPKLPPLEQKPNKTTAEQAELTRKKQRLQELEELSKKQNSSTNTAKPKDKTTLYIGCGIIGIVLIGLVLILVRRNKNKKP